MASRVRPKVKKDSSEHIRTFQTRLGHKKSTSDYPELLSLADRYQRAKRTTYGRASLERTSFQPLKEAICKEFHLPSRMFNAIDLDLKGMVKSSQEKSKFDLAQVQEKIERIDKARAKLEKNMADEALPRKKRQNAKTHFHRKRESRDHHAARVPRLTDLSTNAYPPICFGTRRLLTAQHYREDNGYAGHAAWLEDWRAARANEFLVVGSNDEPSGNKTCRAMINEDGSVKLDLYLGAGHGHAVLDNIRLPFGHAEWVEAIQAADAEFLISKAWQDKTEQEAERQAAEGATPEQIKAYRAERKKERAKQPKAGFAIAYRFKLDSISWRIFVTVTRNIAKSEPDYARGAIGCDLNDQHVSRTRVDAKGEFIDTKDLALRMAGRCSGQRLALIHEVAHELICEALKLGVPIVIERLDFFLKKMRLRDVGCARSARRLSSFAYSRFAAVLKSHARLHGVCVVEVDPAYTSVIGAALHAVPLGLTVHGAAAMAIARRAMAVEETIHDQLRIWVSGRAPRSMERPTALRRKGSVEPSWSGWRDLSKAVHAARDEVREERRTGTQKRRSARLARQIDATIPF